MSTITFRADEATEAALKRLVSGESDRSTVIREAILAAWERREAAMLREESARLADDPADRAEIRAVMAEMEELSSDAW